MTIQLSLVSNEMKEGMDGQQLSPQPLFSLGETLASSSAGVMI